MNSVDIRAEITSQIAGAMAQDCPPWRKPWGAASQHTGLPRNINTQKLYKGVNTLLLMSAGQRSKYWGTKKQWETMGAVLNSPSGFDPYWGTTIIFSSVMEKPSRITGMTDKVFFLRYYTVYNADQIEAPSVESLLACHPNRQRSLAKKFLGRSMRLTQRSAETVYGRIRQRLDSLLPKASIPGDYEPASALLEATGADFRHGGDRAVYWHHPLDYIQMPPAVCFDTVSDYYETALHEVCHWSEADSRMGQARGYKDNYQFSELVAELGACFLAAEIGVPMAQQMLPRNQSYIQSWLSHMGNDTRFIFEAARQASKLADYLLKFQSTPAEV